MRSFAATALVGAGLISSAVAAITNPVDPIVIKGSKFFYKTNGTQFYIRGVAYQQDYTGNGTTSDTTSYTDPLASSSNCARDIPLLTALGTNVIRTYAIDPTQNHDACMQMLNNAGIYVISDLSQPDVSINRNDPQWNNELLSRYTAVIDAMAGYSNVLGFFAGNEVSNAPNNTAASAFVKAAVRDSKAYIKAQNYRTIGVGYATNDDADIRVNMADYFNCGDQSSAIDFWGYNIYSWCGDSSYTTSGYDVRTEEFSTYSVPAFFAEYGCNTPSPRKFTEVQALYGSQMSPVWSGGIVYMYFQEANDFGLVSVSGSTVSKLPDYTNLQSQLAKITPTGVNMASYSPSNTAAACPTTSAWQAKNSPLPPTPNEQLCECMMDTLQCVPSSKVSTDDYGTLFGNVCGYSGSPCAGITANATTGVYGAYSMCNATQQLAWAFNAYYVGQGKSASACSFGGSASLKSSTAPPSSCSSLLNAAASGTGTVSSNPTGTGSSGSGSSGSSSSSKGAASSVDIHHVSFGGFASMSFCVIAALISGVAMIAL